mmetsp:Transcript_7473/g.11073  ORF Transcript_7473/g.11073 Transcript_7473/m.11073 type:complete len:646 (+) Transcript_7473:2876-4813(+)
MKQEEHEKSAEYHIDHNKETLWIEFIAVVTFDMEIGQKLERLFPDCYRDKLSTLNIKELTYLSFPDSNATNIKTNGSMYYLFKMKLDSKGDKFYGHVFYTQKEDKSISRGYSMKSVVILTKYPFLSPFKQILSILGQEYIKTFGDDSVSSNRDLIEEAYQNISSWDIPSMGKSYSLNFFDHIIPYKSPVFRATRSMISSNHELKIENLVKITDDDLILKASSKKESKELKKKKISKSKLVGLSSTSKPGVIKRVRASSIKYNQSHVSSATTSGLIKSSLQGRKFPYQNELNLYEVFKKNLNQLVQYWELVLLGQSILVYSPSSYLCSRAVLSLVSLIFPIVYGGEYRPYFTVHNSEFSQFKDLGRENSKSFILGITNPFFIKSYNDWPHILAIGEKLDQQEKNIKSNGLFAIASSIFTSGSSSKGIEESKSKLMWTYKESFLTQRKFVFNYQMLTKQLLSTIPQSDFEDEEQSQIVSIQIHRFFEHLTCQFLEPLTNCFREILRGLKVCLIQSEIKKSMKPKIFYNYVVNHGYNRSIFATSEKNVFQIYARFVYSPNFKSWINSNVELTFYNSISNVNPQELCSSLTDIEIIDLFLRIQKEFISLNKAGTLDHYILNTIRNIQLEMINYAPETIQSSLERKICQF